MKKISSTQKDLFRDMVKNSNPNPSTDDIMNIFNQGKAIYFRDILDAVKVSIELTSLDVKFVVLSLLNEEYRNKKFKIKIPEKRKMTYEDFETIYTYIILAAFGQDPDQDFEKIKCIHKSIFGEPPITSVVFKDPLRMFVEYNGEKLSYIKTRDSSGGETYRITSATNEILSVLKEYKVSSATRGFVIYNQDPDFESYLLQLDL